MNIVKFKKHMFFLQINLLSFSGMEISFSTFFVSIGFCNLSGIGNEWKGKCSGQLCVCVFNISLKMLPSKISSNPRLFCQWIQVGYLRVGRRCRGVHTKESSIWPSKGAYVFMIFDVIHLPFWPFTYFVFEQEEISGWRDDLFTARKSAINLLGVISMSKVTPMCSLMNIYGHVC